MAIIQKNKYLYLIYGGVLLSLLTACASIDETPKPSKPNSMSLLMPQSDIAKMGLPAQTLNLGECGLFVWAVSPTKPFILFSEASKGQARWFNKVEEALTLVESSGAVSYGQSSTNSYVRPNGEALTLVLTDAEAIENGMRYKSGTLNFDTSEGWKKVLPVIGLAVCQI